MEKTALDEALDLELSDLVVKKEKMKRFFFIYI
jgi:hypothetical protein